MAILEQEMVTPIQTCTRCIMDSTVSGIQFDAQGFCNYCTDYIQSLEKMDEAVEQSKQELQAMLSAIKSAGKRKEYDCILGISGGLDSSYVLYNIKKMGLRPLAVHLDNGWNSELAVSNIEKLVKGLDVELYTYIIDWEEFRDLQRAFFKANVVDIEMLTDHGIGAILYRVAREFGVGYIIDGCNTALEGMPMPPGWTHFKKDLRNIKAIHKQFGDLNKIRSFPTMSVIQYFRYLYIHRIKTFSILDYIPYNRDDAIQTLIDEVDWRPYEKKHYESVFTRFYQGYILPRKFKVDKRKVHYSTLICSGQMSRQEALSLIEQRTYEDLDLLEEDKNFVLNKLGFSEEAFEAYLEAPVVPHKHYPSNTGVRDFYNKWIVK